MKTDADFLIDAAGWCAAARRCDCNNFDARPQDAEIDLLVIHNISLPPEETGGTYIEDFFANRLDYSAHPYFEQLRELRVSAHFLIATDGSLLQFVPTLARAWHAGQSQFEGRPRCNDFSIGIELEGSDHQKFRDAQYQTLTSLTLALAQRHPIFAVRGHEHIAPGRKTDPGPHFDWARFRAELGRAQATEPFSVLRPEIISFPT
jgi:AmpD protein